jgi:hypothetical protein
MLDDVGVGIFRAQAGVSLEEKLEQGKVILWQPGLLPLPSEDDLVFLRTELGKAIRLKNISYHPRDDGRGHLSGVAREYKERTRRVLDEHARAVRTFLEAQFPRYAKAWRAGKVNFRPLQEKGRALSRHSSNELIHVDAFASGATHGDRVFRFFTNIHPEEARVWRSAGTFLELVTELGERAHVKGRQVREGLADRLLSSTIRGLAKLAPPVELADTSPYDRTMKRMHDFLKDDDAFQKDERRWIGMEFPPFHSWAVLTDMVSHAAVSGQHALVATFHVDVNACVRPELAPINVLRSFT